MSKNNYIVLGNGFSIDLINKLNKSDEINLFNLFEKGDEVCFPKTEEKGFLSSKYCPNLWQLGVNSTIPKSDSTQMINDIITCANVYNLASKNSSNPQSEYSVYVKAYFELTSYLRCLFIYYNSLISDDELKQYLKNSPLIDYIQNAIANNNKVNIITYNYDVWLERLLKLSNIPFSISGFDTVNNNVILYKPHGSISFSFNVKSARSAPYVIRQGVDSISQEISDFSIIYDFENDYPIVNALIPPAGDSGRYSLGWISQIRNDLGICVKNSSDADELVLFGISYWHVDRNEIDDILINMNSSIDIKYINPFPPSDLNAVLSSLFKKYIHYKNGNSLLRR